MRNKVAGPKMNLDDFVAANGRKAARHQKSWVFIENPLTSQELDLMKIADRTGGYPKMGIDDFVVANGSEAQSAFKKLPRLKFEGFELLLEHRNNWAFIKKPLSYLELRTQELRSVRDYKEINSNKIVQVPYLTGAGKPAEAPTPVTELFAESKLRDEVTYEGVTFVPKDGLWVTDDRKLNLFRPYRIEPRRGDLTPYIKLRDHLLRGQPPVVQRYLEWWLAHRIRRPEIKPMNFILLSGLKQGEGKGLLGEIFGKQFGPYYIEIPGNRFTERFNSWWIEKHLFMMVSELMETNARKAADLIKMMITQRMFTSEKKFLDAYQLPDYLGYLITTNHPSPLYLEPHDRRCFPVKVCQEAQTEEAARLSLDSSTAATAFRESRDGQEAMSYYVEKIDLDEFSPFEAPPMTQAKYEIIEDSRSSVEGFLTALHDDPGQYWVDDYKNRTLKRCDLGEAIEVTELPDYKKVFSKNPTVVGIAMHKAGFHKVNKAKPVLTQNGLKNLWAFRNEEKWLRASHEELARHYNETNPDRSAKPFGSTLEGVDEKDRESGVKRWLSQHMEWKPSTFSSKLETYKRYVDWAESYKLKPATLDEFDAALKLYHPDLKVLRTEDGLLYKNINFRIE